MPGAKKGVAPLIDFQKSSNQDKEGYISNSNSTLTR